jgi:hypothetical protein
MLDVGDSCPCIAESFAYILGNKERIPFVVFQNAHLPEFGVIENFQIVHVTILLLLGSKFLALCLPTPSRLFDVRLRALPATLALWFGLLSIPRYASAGFPPPLSLVLLPPVGAFSRGEWGR